MLFFSHMNKPSWLSLTKIKHLFIFLSLYKDTSSINPSNSIYYMIAKLSKLKIQILFWSEAIKYSSKLSITNKLRGSSFNLKLFYNSRLNKSKTLISPSLPDVTKS